MFNYGNANEAQKEAISATDGLVLITAGPGTGKTFTLVKRAVYLIQECGIKPEQIMMATFTEKAAKELITRITNELAERNVSVNVNEMYIGTFHSLCLRIIKENLEFDVESTLAQLTEPMMIERVNALLGENPNLLETDKYILLHSLLGRDLYMEGQLIPIRAAEIKKVAKNNGGF